LAEGPRAGRGPPPPRQPLGPFAAASVVSAALCRPSTGRRVDEASCRTGTEGVDAGFRHDRPEPRASRRDCTPESWTARARVNGLAVAWLWVCRLEAPVATTARTPVGAASR